MAGWGGGGMQALGLCSRPMCVLDRKLSFGNRLPVASRLCAPTRPFSPPTGHQAG